MEVDDVTSFDTCPSSDSDPEVCISTDNGIDAYVEYINTSENKIFIKVMNTEDSSDLEHETIEGATTVDNANEFVAFDANIVSVTRI